MNYDKYIRKYEKDGIVIIPGVFTQEEMNIFRDQAYAAAHHDNPQYKHPHLDWTPTGYPSLLYWPALTSPFIDEIRRDERLSNIVFAFLGKNVKQLNNQIYFREPGDGDQFAWHQDITFRQPRSRYPDIENGYLQTIIVVDEITEDNGAVEFIPGSHKGGELNLVKGTDQNNLRNFIRGNRRGVKYTANPGDVMLWSVLTIHGSEPNESGRPRMTYMNGFATDIAAPYNWPYYLNRGVMQDIDHTMIP